MAQHRRTIPRVHPTNLQSCKHHGSTSAHDPSGSSPAKRSLIHSPHQKRSTPDRRVMLITSHPNSSSALQHPGWIAVANPSLIRKCHAPLKLIIWTAQSSLPRQNHHWLITSSLVPDTHGSSNSKYSRLILPHPRPI